MTMRPSVTGTVDAPGVGVPSKAVRLGVEAIGAGPSGTRAVLTGVSMEARAGEVVALLGANGCGKTTLLRTLMGLLPERGGRALLDGTPLGRGAAARASAGVALAFQNPDDQLFGATLEEDVAAGPRARGLSPAEVTARVREALEAVGLSGLGSREVEQLSFGEKKRACLAGVLALRPRVLLLDEPTAGLDPVGEREAAGLLRRVARETEAAVLVATHAVDEVPLFADRVAVLGEGTLLAFGPPEQAFADAALLARARLRPPAALELWTRLGSPVLPAPLTLDAAAERLRPLLEARP